MIRDSVVDIDNVEDVKQEVWTTEDGELLDRFWRKWKLERTVNISMLICTAGTYSLQSLLLLPELISC